MNSKPVWLGTMALVGSLAMASGLAEAGNTTVSQREATAAQRPGACNLPGPYDYPQGSEPVNLRPRDFTTRIDNPYWPMKPGNIWRFVEREGGERLTVKVTVTNRTTMISGIRARVVHDVVRSGGELVEDTLDWYAQDSGGSIWYLGEKTAEYENGKVSSTEGSWRYGQDGAQAGILIPADPQVGCTYREEFRTNEAEDRARILSVKERYKGPTGFYRNVLQTANTTPLEPRLLENKFYARGVGPVLALAISPALGNEVLVGFKRG